MVRGWVSREPICKGITTSLGEMENTVFSSPPSRKSGLHMLRTRAELLEIVVRVSPAARPHIGASAWWWSLATHPTTPQKKI